MGKWRGSAHLATLVGLRWAS
eukprot:COSAG03_NODE_18795_length_348_cov_0.967871_1_plen_20_part_10